MRQYTFFALLMLLVACNDVRLGPYRDAAPDADAGPRCGDGVREDDETCDDGNTVAGDGCEDDCTPTPCLDADADGVCDPDDDCADGFRDEGTHCEDIDECQVDNGGCDTLTACTNTDGGFECGACPAGYAGDGASGCDACPGAGEVVCSGNGVCDDGADGTGVCTCDPDWAGEACDVCADGGDLCGGRCGVDYDTDATNCGACGVACDDRAACSNGVCADACYLALGVTCDVFSEAYLKSSTTDEMEQFGASVAIDGDTIVVGAPFQDTDASGARGFEFQDSGAAFVFVRSGATWTQQAVLKASNAGRFDEFGASVAISGDTIVVGASREDSIAREINGDESDNNPFMDTDSGAAYVFVRSGATWTQQAYLKASNTDVSDRFGNAVAISGNTVVVGAFFESSAAREINGDEADDSAIAAGAAYVFVRSGATWTQQAYLKAFNADASDQFANSVAIDGDTIVVGARNEYSSGFSSDDWPWLSGAVYVFVRSETTWTQQAFLQASNFGADDEFGWSVAIDDDTLVVGAIGESSNGVESDNSAGRSGAVYVFVRSGSEWTQKAYLKASHIGRIDTFGAAVAIVGDTLVVGAPGQASGAVGVGGGAEGESHRGSGAAYVFVRSEDVWTEQAYVKASNTDAGDVFGNSIAFDGYTMVVGASLEDSSAVGVNGDQTDNDALDGGAVYVRRIAP